MRIAAADAGIPIPDGCVPAEVETVWPCDAPYRQMFETLSRSRTITIGMGGVMQMPIAFSEIVCYARVMGLADNPQEIDECVTIVSAQDTVYLDYAAERNAAKVV